VNVAQVPIVIPDGFTREQLLAAVDREIRLRERVYPRWVALGKMSGAKSTEELASMRAVHAVLAQLPPTPAVQPGLPFGGRT
jgi:hypothetical protein